MSSIYDDLLRIHKLIAQKPVPRSIWFIDRDRAFWILHHAMPAIEPSPYVLGGYHLLGMPVQVWHTMDIRLEMDRMVHAEGRSFEQARQAFPFCQPGIWVQMSNGKHEHLEIVC